MKLYGFQPNRRHGQNFLVNRPTAEKFVNTALIDPSKVNTVVEIGPGVGSITEILCERFQNVIAIEKDQRLIKLWETEIPKPANLRLIQGDASTFDFAHLSKELGHRLVVFGNLPFNVSTMILLRLLQNWQQMSYAPLTFQKEVTERLLAKPNTKEYGSLTIQTQIYCNVDNRMVIQKQQYFPVPKVDSKVAGFVFLETPRLAVADTLPFEALVRQLFLYRRKTMLNSLKLSKRFAAWHELWKEKMQQLKIVETARVETLSLETLYELFRYCTEKRGNYGLDN